MKPRDFTEAGHVEGAGVDVGGGGVQEGLRYYTRVALHLMGWKGGRPKYSRAEPGQSRSSFRGELWVYMQVTLTAVEHCTRGGEGYSQGKEGTDWRERPEIG